MIKKKKVIVKKVIDGLIIFIYSLLLNRRPQLIHITSQETNFYSHVFIYLFIILVLLVTNYYIFKKLLKAYQ